MIHFTAGTQKNIIQCGGQSPDLQEGYTPPRFGCNRHPPHTSLDHLHGTDDSLWNKT